ncbi:MAG: peptidoglycan DD-metalloendopeptidase family protein [Oscillospiraceae bacterium]|nr:peptidoglycan DD-metalloendopeptidase family protein [Oscillospiraceae bacterium]
MEGLFLRVLAVSAALSPLLLILLLGRRWLERRYAPKTRWGLWLGVGAALLLVPWLPKPAAPVVVEAPAYTLTLPVRPRTGGGLGAKGQGEAPGENPDKPAPPEMGENRGGGLTQVGTGGESSVRLQGQTQPTVSSRAEGERSLSLTGLGAGVWLAGMLLTLLWQGGGYLLLRRRLLSQARPVSGLEGYAAELGVERRVGFFHCETVSGPMTLGVFRPVILLPPEGLAVAALRHELCHVKRYDVAYKVFLLLVCALHWFNPLVWGMYRRADRDVEACCDADVVAGQDGGYRRSYGELLLSAAGKGRETPFTTSFGGGKEQMKARLTQLFHPGKQSKALVCGGLALAVLLGSLVACREREELKDGLYCATAADVLGSYPVGEPDAEGEDYGSIRLSLLEFSETDGPHGKPLGEHTLPLSAELTLRDGWDPGEKGTRDWQERVAEFLEWPIRRNSIPAGAEYLVLERAGGEVTRMFWIEWPRDDSLYTNDTYRFTLRLPQSWAGNYTVEEEGREIRFLYAENSQPLMTLHVLEEAGDREGWEIVAVYDRYVYWEFPGGAGGPIEGLREDIRKKLDTEGFFIWLELAVVDAGERPLTENTMPTLVYYDPVREFLLYRTEDTAYFYYGDTPMEYRPDQSAGRRVLWRCDVSEDENTVYLSDVFDDGENRNQRFYAWDIGGRTLEETDSIPDGVDHMTHVGTEELFYPGFRNGTSLKSNVIKTEDGTLVGLYVDELIGNTMDYLQLARMGADGSYEGGEPFLTPERIPAPGTYREPDWGFTLDLPEELVGNYVVARAANNWNFYDKGLYSGGGYLFSLWAEDSATQEQTIQDYPGQWPGKILGEKNGITYTATFWEEEMTTPSERESEGYMARMEAAKGIGGEDLDLSAVTRSSGYLWPLPYIEYGSDVLLGEGEDTLRILSPEGVTVQSTAGGRVAGITTHPVTGEQTVTVAHPDGVYSEYSHLEYVQVENGAEVKRGGIIGFAKKEEGQRWVAFSLREGSSSWETARPVDPWRVEYRTYDFLPVTQGSLTLAGDPGITVAMEAVLRGEATFYNVETGEDCYANALPQSDGVEVTVRCYTQLDMDNDTIPEVVLWLQRGEDIYQLGSIILRYEKGWVYGYPMGYRSMVLEDLKADGTFSWSGGAPYNGWGRKDFQRDETVNTVWHEGDTFYVNGNSVSEEAYVRAEEEQLAKPDVEWFSISGGNPVGLKEP